MNSTILFFTFCAYLLGSIPFAILIGVLFYKTDVRKQGSGNPGATNTFRILGKKAGISVLILDASKGFFPVYLGSLYFNDTFLLLLGGASVLGHCFSPFLKGKGGKGIATLLGTALAFDWSLALACITIFIFLLCLFRYVSLASLVAIFSYGILGIFVFKHQNLSFLIFGFSSMILTLYTHRKNLKSLLVGKENKI